MITWDDFKNTLLHESAHAVFGKDIPPSTYEMPNKYKGMGIWEGLKNFLRPGPVADPAFPDSTLDKEYPLGSEGTVNDPWAQSKRVWDSSKRAGSMIDEYPVYNITYQKGNLKDVTEANADEFVKRYLPMVKDEKKRSTLESIYKSNKVKKPSGNPAPMK